MMYAIVNANGRQRRITRGETVWFEEQAGEVGQKITFDNVLALNDGTATIVGTPRVDGAVVEAQVLRHVRDRKVDIFKYKRRKGYTRKKGHRHDYVELRVTDILLNGESYAPQAVAAAEAAPESPAPMESAAAFAESAVATESAAPAPAPAPESKE